MGPLQQHDRPWLQHGTGKSSTVVDHGPKQALWEDLIKIQSAVQAAEEEYESAQIALIGEGNANRPRSGHVSLCRRHSSEAYGVGMYISVPPLSRVEPDKAELVTISQQFRELEQ